MPKLYNRARMTTATTGTGTLTLGSAVSKFQTFANAGVADGEIVRYVIEDGTAWEIGYGTYTASGTTLARSVQSSTNSNIAINLSGSAEVFIDGTADELRSTAFAITSNDSNFYQIPQHFVTTSGTTAIAANTLYAVPLVVARRTAFTRIGASVTTAVGGTNARMGIYNDSTGKPGTLLLDAGTVSTGTNGLKEITIAQSVNRGLYWLVLVSDGASTFSTSVSTVTPLGVNSSFGRIFSIQRAFTYGTLPSDESAQTYTANTTFALLEWLRVV